MTGTASPLPTATVRNAPGPGPDTISTVEFALLLGVPEATLRAEIARQREASGMAAGFVGPGPWLRQGKRIGKEVQAATGSGAMHDAITYLRGQHPTGWPA